MLKLQAVIFDLDDTIYPEREYVHSGYRAIGDFLRNKTKRDDDFAEWLWQRFLSGQSANAFNAMNEQFKLNLGDSDIAELIQVYRNHKPQIYIRPGIRELFEELKNRGLKLGIISDGFLPAQQYKVDALGIEEHFEHIILTESLGPERKFWKPSPKAFEMIAEKLATPHSSCCYIADNLTKDFLAPNNLNWQTILLRTTDQIHLNSAPQAGQPKHTVNSVSELKELLIN